MAGLLSQNGLAKREATLAGFETGGSGGLLDRAGFQTSPNLADPGIANNLRQSAIDASQAPLASVSGEPAPTAANAKLIVDEGGEGSSRDADSDPNQGAGTSDLGFVEGMMEFGPNLLGISNPVGLANMIGGAIAAPKDRTPSLIGLAVDKVTGFINDVFGPDVGADAAGPGQGSEGTGAAGPGAGNDAPGASAGAGGDPGVDSAESGNDGPGSGGSSPGKGGKGQQSGPRGGGGDGGDGGSGGGGGSCFAAGTEIDMIDGSTKPVEDIHVGDRTRGGEVTMTMVFSASGPIFNYRGVVVHGSHAVLENGRWKRVANADDARQLDEDEAAKVKQVFVFDTTEHRIFANEVIFADYSEVDDDSKACAAIDGILLDSLQVQEGGHSRASIHWTGAS